MCVGTHAPCVLFRCHALAHVLCVESFKVGLKALMCVHVIISGTGEEGRGGVCGRSIEKRVSVE